MSGEDLEALMQQALKEALGWKGRAMAAGPALKVALAALQAPEFLECPWCRVAFEHAEGCTQQVAIKVLKDAIGDS